MSTERERLEHDGATWKRWGPYLAERAWGTVREDYSAHGTAWEYFPHDHARARVYRWNEDGLAGVCDDSQFLCFALALWNGRDPILKERLFGLTGNEGNHGEDCKEYYYYLDSTPTHSWMRWLYKYPHAAYPYEQLLEETRRRGKHDPEYELIDTGVFAEDRYCDVFLDYAKAGPDDLCIRITAENRGPEPTTLHLLPTLWFRNTWSWGYDDRRPTLSAVPTGRGAAPAVHARHHLLGDYVFYAEGADGLLFTENETNAERLFGTRNATPHVKDAFHEHLVHGRREAVNAEPHGTKAAAWYERTIPAGGSVVIRLRLRRAEGDGRPRRAPFADFDATCAARQREADEFYAESAPPGMSADQRLVARQALAGMLWTKQYFYYDLDLWLEEHGAGMKLAPRERRLVRNREWSHMVNDDIISMPDKWEYPWFAAWDLAFHMIPFARLDGKFAKDQLSLFLR